MVTIRHERPADVAAREALLDISYGPVRFTKTSERLREGRLPELALVAAEAGSIVGTVRLWQVAAGGQCRALLLGPLAVHPDRRKCGIGSALVQRALREASRRRHRAVLLVGDAPVLRPLRLFERKDRGAVAAWTHTSGIACSPASSRPAHSTAHAASFAAAAAWKLRRMLPRWLPVSTATSPSSRRTRHEPVAFCLGVTEDERNHPEAPKLAAARPFRWADCDDRLRLDRQGHLAAHRTAYRLRSLEARRHRARRQRPASARRAPDQVHQAGDHQRAITAMCSPRC